MSNLINLVKNPYSEFLDPVSSPIHTDVRDPLELDTKEVLEEIGKYYTQSSSFLIALCRAWRTGTNLWTDGPGGYGKSDISYSFGHYLYKNKFISRPPFVFSCSKSVMEDALFGGIDVKAYKEESVQRFMVDNSPFNFEFVIWEEYGDLSDDAIRALKDAKSSGHIRNGLQLFKCKTRCHIACGNVSIKEFQEAGDDLEALTQRFMQDMKVIWATHDIDDYMEFFKRKGVDTKLAVLLADLCFMANNNGYHPNLVGTTKKSKSNINKNIKVTPRRAGQLLYMLSVEGGDMNKVSFFNCIENMGVFRNVLPTFKSFYGSRLSDLKVIDKFEEAALKLEKSVEDLLKQSIPNKTKQNRLVLIETKIKEIVAGKDYKASEFGTKVIGERAQKIISRISKERKVIQKAIKEEVQNSQNDQFADIFNNFKNNN